MQEKSLNQRLIVIAVVVLMGVWMIWPPQERLRPGLDIAGGTSMIFEIEADEERPTENIADEMIQLLRRRVDPQGVYDLTWRPVGKNRIEVQMPLAPVQNKERREAFEAARGKLFESSVKRDEIERAAAMPPAERDAAVSALSAGSVDLEKAVRSAIDAYQAREAARAARAAGPTTAPASDPASSQAATASAPAPDRRALDIAFRDAVDGYEDALLAVSAQNLSPSRLQDTLEMDRTSGIRARNLNEFKDRFPALKTQLDEVVAKYDEWRKNRALLENPADLIRLMRGAGVLEFRIMTAPDASNPTKFDRYREQLDKYGAFPQPGDTDQWFRIDNPQALLNVKSVAELNALALDPRNVPAPLVVGRKGDTWYVLAQRGADKGMLQDKASPWRLRRAFETRDNSGKRCVGFELDAIGGGRFRVLTRDHVNQQLGIFVDNMAYSSANIQTEIGTQGIITGDFSSEKIRYLVQTMQAGALPGRLKDTPISERTIGSSLGQTNLKLAFNAGMIGLGAVLVVMMGYYFMCGAIANVGMLLNLFLTLSAMAMLGARFNLAGIAGLILGIGMTVDANILIFERMREEKERGASLRMIIRNGYDKALSTILDSNITTLLTCMILYYVGSEEIKGFGLTLGWGIILNLFTAVFVTRTLFTLLVKYNVIREIRMQKLIGVPNIDWYGKRKFFVPASFGLIGIGLVLLFFRGARDVFDVEFLGGVNAEFAVKKSVADKYNDVTIRRLIEEEANRIEQLGARLADATVSADEGQAGRFRVAAPGIPAPLLAAMIAEPLESGESGKLLQRDGVQIPESGDTVFVLMKEGVTAEQVKQALVKLADRSGDSIPLAGENIRRANVGQVLESGGEEGKFFNITTTETNKGLVRYALVEAIGEGLQTQPRVQFELRGPNGEPYPVLASRLENVIPDLPPGVSADVTNYQGGAAFHLDKLSPPQTAIAIRNRISAMRFQPDYADWPYRTFDVIGVQSAGKDADGQETFSGVAVVVFDEAHPYSLSRELWQSEFAAPELSLIRATLEQEQSLRKVTTFKPQIASQSQTRAIMAMLFAWAMIIAYLWVRFGKPRYGAAGVAALVHDVGVALAFVGLAGWIGNNAFGHALLIEDFKIDMTIIAALLTIIGYSINDTIVIFDRIRELRGRMGTVTPQLINDAVNQTMSRTILTAMTVFLVLLVMYVFGGPSIRGFNFCMLIGTISGSYSTVAIASPLLLFFLPAKTTGRGAAL